MEQCCLNVVTRNRCSQCLEMLNDEALSAQECLNMSNSRFAMEGALEKQNKKGLHRWSFLVQYAPKCWLNDEGTKNAPGFLKIRAENSMV